MRNLLPWLALLLTSAMGGASYPIIRYLVGYIEPLDLLALTFIPATIIALIILPIFYRADFLKALKKDWWFFILVCGVALFGFQFLVNHVMNVLPAGPTSLIVGIWPVITVILGWLFIGEKLEARKLAGCIIAFAGVAALVIFGSEEEAVKMNMAPVTWIAYSLLGFLIPLASAIVTTASRWYLTCGGWNNGKSDPVMYSLLLRLPAGLMVLVFWRGEGLTDSLDAVPVPWIFWSLVVMLVISRTMGFMLWNWALKRIEAGNTAIFSYTGTVFALIFSWLFLGEHYGTATLLAAAGIVTGVIIANLDKWKKGVFKHAPMGRA